MFHHFSRYYICSKDVEKSEFNNIAILQKNYYRKDNILLYNKASQTNNGLIRFLYALGTLLYLGLIVGEKGAIMYNQCHKTFTKILKMTPGSRLCNGKMQLIHWCTRILQVIEELLVAFKYTPVYS